jgi:hypothetical protein
MCWTASVTIHRQPFRWQVRKYFSFHSMFAGPINAFLSWRLFVPLSRLTYSAYLCHYVVLLYNSGSSRAPGYLSDYTVVSTQQEERDRGKQRRSHANVIVDTESCVLKLLPYEFLRNLCGVSYRITN